MKIVSLLLVKRDSKRLKNKNWRDFCGKPMFVWNLIKCRGIFDDVYVSSDSDEILKMAKKRGAIPIKRPQELCGDTPNIPVYQHALKFMNNPDAIVAVQACSPTIKDGLLEVVRELMLMGSQEIMTCHPIERNQDYHGQNFKIYGSVWALSKERLLNYGDPYKPNPEILLIDDSVDVHNINDFRKAVNQHARYKHYHSKLQ